MKKKGNERMLLRFCRWCFARPPSSHPPDTLLQTFIVFPLKAAIKFEIMESTPLSLSRLPIRPIRKSSSDIYELAKHVVRNWADFALLLMPLIQHIGWLAWQSSFF